MDERAFYRESQATKPATLNCTYCRTADTYDLRWLVRRKVDRLPRNADERDWVLFVLVVCFLVFLVVKVSCKNPRCRRSFDISGIKTTAFLTDCSLPAPPRKTSC